MKKRMELQQYISLLEEQQLIKEAFWEKGALSQKVEYISYDSAERSEERRVGKECRSRWSPYH